MYSPFKRFATPLTLRGFLQLLSVAAIIGGGIAMACGIELVLRKP